MDPDLQGWKQPSVRTVWVPSCCNPRMPGAPGIATGLSAPARKEEIRQQVNDPEKRQLVQIRMLGL